MMSQGDFTALVEEIEALGYSTETAAHYAATIGDTPELDAAGLVIVRDAGEKVIARLKLKSFDD